MTIELFWNVIWIIWMFLIVLAYFLTQTEKIKPSQLIFTHINLTWSVFLLISLIIDFNLASFVLEIVWISISLYWYFKYFRNKKLNKKVS